MPDNNVGSATAGSLIGGSVPNPNNPGGSTTGQTQAAQGTQVDPEQYKNLEQLVGRQGTELGEYRKFFEDAGPLLEKLQKNPEIIQAILTDKITSDLAKAASEGRVDVKSAQVVTEAHTQVKTDLGKTGYAKASPEEITRLVEERVASLKSEMDTKFKEKDEENAFEKTTNDFIANTKDFTKYAKQIEEWLDDHDVTDIKVAYYAVKGELSEKEALARAEIDAAEHQKNLVAGVGGSGMATYIAGTDNLVDRLIGSKSNPNVF